MRSLPFSFSHMHPPHTHTPSADWRKSSLLGLQSVFFPQHNRACPQSWIPGPAWKQPWPRRCLQREVLRACVPKCQSGEETVSNVQTEWGQAEAAFGGCPMLSLFDFWSNGFLVPLDQGPLTTWKQLSPAPDGYTCWPATPSSCPGWKPAHHPWLPSLSLPQACAPR